MVKGGSLLSQITGLVPRVEFQRIVQEHEGEKAAKGFTCWDQFVAMLFCQLGQAHSLSEIVGGLGSMMGKKVHLGLRDAPKKSTLSYANAHRPWEIYRDTFFALLNRGRGMVADRLKHPCGSRARCFRWMRRSSICVSPSSHGPSSGKPKAQ